MQNEALIYVTFPDARNIKRDDPSTPQPWKRRVMPCTFTGRLDISNLAAKYQI